MPSVERLLTLPEDWRVTASATNGAATATKAAVVGARHIAFGFSISASGLPAATVEAQVRENAGATLRIRMQIPAAAFAPIIYEFRHPMVFTTGNDCDITLPALGAGIIGRVELWGMTEQMTA